MRGRGECSYGTPVHVKGVCHRSFTGRMDLCRVYRPSIQMLLPAPSGRTFNSTLLTHVAAKLFKQTRSGVVLAKRSNRCSGFSVEGYCPSPDTVNGMVQARRRLRKADRTHTHERARRMFLRNTSACQRGCHRSFTGRMDLCRVYRPSIQMLLPAPSGRTFNSTLLTHVAAKLFKQTRSGVVLAKRSNRCSGFSR